MINQQKILVISGRKQAGKNTLANFLEGIVLLQNGLIDEFEVSEFTKGELFVKRGGYYEDKNFIDKRKLSNFGNLDIRKYEFADKLKLVMIEMFGLNDSQVNGPNGEKDTLTKYVWENMPGLAHTEFAGYSGRMTARQLTQFVGGNLFRKMDNEIHLKRTYEQIQKDRVPICTINGARYPNEVVYRPDFPAEVKTLRLARVMHPEDTHSSETSLDSEKFNWNNFDAIIWNQTMSIEQTCAAALSWFRVWGWVK